MVKARNLHLIICYSMRSSGEKMVNEQEFPLARQKPTRLPGVGGHAACRQGRGPAEREGPKPNQAGHHASFRSVHRRKARRGRAERVFYGWLIAAGPSTNATRPHVLCSSSPAILLRNYYYLQDDVWRCRFT